MSDGTILLRWDSPQGYFRFVPQENRMGLLFTSRYTTPAPLRADYNSLKVLIKRDHFINCTFSWLSLGVRGVSTGIGQLGQ